MKRIQKLLTFFLYTFLLFGPLASFGYLIAANCLEKEIALSPDYQRYARFFFNLPTLNSEKDLGERILSSFFVPTGLAYLWPSALVIFLILWNLNLFTNFRRRIFNEQNFLQGLKIMLPATLIVAAAGLNLPHRYPLIFYGVQFLLFILAVSCFAAISCGGAYLQWKRTLALGWAICWRYILLGGFLALALFISVTWIFWLYTAPFLPIRSCDKISVAAGAMLAAALQQYVRLAAPVVYGLFLALVFGGLCMIWSCTMGFVFNRVTYDPRDYEDLYASEEEDELEEE